MKPLPYDQQYAELKALGLTPSAAAAAMCRAYPGQVVWVLRWLSTKSPDASTFFERWLRRTGGENRERACLVGYVEAGCFFYSSISHRPNHTVFISWEDVQSIWIQDGLNQSGLSLYCPLTPYGGKDIDAGSNMEGFGALVREVSQRFFGAPDYLERKFRPGSHPIRRFQVWNKLQAVEPHSVRYSRP